MNKLDLNIGMRVLDTSGSRHRECTIIAFTRRQPHEDRPNYALVRRDSFGRRQEWINTIYLYPIESEIPGEGV